MAVSFIFAGGFTRTVAKWLLVEWQVSEQWMPFITGLIFALPLALLLYMLERIPLPNAADIEQSLPLLCKRIDDYCSGVSA